MKLWVTRIFEQEVNIALPDGLMVDVRQAHVFQHVLPFSYVSNAVDYPKIKSGTSLTLAVSQACEGVEEGIGGRIVAL